MEQPQLTQTVQAPPIQIRPPPKVSYTFTLHASDLYPEGVELEEVVQFITCRPSLQYFLINSAAKLKSNGFKKIKRRRVVLQGNTWEKVTGAGFTIMGETCETRVAKYRIHIVTYNILLKYRMTLLLFSFVVALYVRNNTWRFSTYFAR